MNRYSKQIKLEGFGTEAQEKLANAKVLVIGAGGLGCPAITYLASAGIGIIGIVDHDLVEENNLPRQPLYSTQDIGKPKAVIASGKAQKLNPDAKIITWQTRITPDNALKIIKDFDLVLDCTDNYEARYLINDACVILDKPWIYGAVEAWEGQLATFNFLQSDRAKTPTYRCIFPEPDLEALSCNDLGVIGTMPGTIGILQANEAIKAITGVGKITKGLLLVNLQANSFQTIKIPRNEGAISKIKTLKTDYSGLENIAHEQITIQQIQGNRDKYYIIDIREAYELDEKPFPMANKHVPMGDLIQNGFDFDSGISYILVCASGARSLLTVKKLKGTNPEIDILSLDGGVN